MTIGGALSVLNDLLNADDIPFYYKPAIKAVMNTIELDSFEIPTGSTTKNNLGVRKFEGIDVIYPPKELCTYPEYRGKPYFGIKYKENGEIIVGYGTYKPEVLSRYLKDYFISTTNQDIKSRVPLKEIKKILGECKTEQELRISERDEKAILLISDIFNDVYKRLSEYNAKEAENE